MSNWSPRPVDIALTLEGVPTWHRHTRAAPAPRKCRTRRSALDGSGGPVGRLSVQPSICDFRTVEAAGSTMALIIFRLNDPGAASWSS